MKFRDAQKKVIPNIFRDLAKLTAAALVLGQFVPGRVFDLISFFGGISAAVVLGFTAVVSAVEEKGGES